MKSLLKNLAIIMAVLLLFGSFRFDVQAKSKTPETEMTTAETQVNEIEQEPTDPDAGETDPLPDEPSPTESSEPEPSEPEPTIPSENAPTEPAPDEPASTEPEEIVTEPEKAEVPEEEEQQDLIAPELSEAAAPWMYGSARRSIGILSNGLPSGRVVNPDLVAENELAPGQVRMTKTAAPVAGLVNTWDVTLRVAGRPQQLTSDIVLLIDVSGSMGYSISGMPYNRLHYTQEAAKHFVDTVLTADPQNTQISVVSFSGYSSAGTGNTATIRHTLANTPESLKLAIGALSVAGSSTQYTHTQSGLVKAQEVLNTSTAAKKTIVLFSDGLPNRNFRIDNPTAADFYSGNSSQRLSRKDLPASRFDYNYSLSDGASVNIGGTTYYYSSPNATIAEGAITRSKGYTLYAIGMYAGAEGQATLNETADPGKSYDSDAAGLDAVFQSIAGQLGSPVSTVSITDPMASGFIIADTTSIVKTSGNTVYDATTDTLTWNFPMLSQSGSGDIKYEELTYRIVITEDTPYVTGNVLLPTNGPTPMSFTDVEGKASVNYFQIPQVDPVFVTLDKSLLNGVGNPISSDKEFTISLDSVNYLLKADDPLKVIKKVWNVGNYQVSESPEPDYIVSYKVNGNTSQQLALAQAGPDQNVVVTNQEIPLNPVDVNLSGSKNLDGRNLANGEFSFRLYESDINGIEGTLLETVSNAGNNFAFVARTFVDGDEGTYYYLIKEVEGILGGVSYDQAKYLVKVVITDDLAGNLEAEVTYFIFDAVEEDWVAAVEVVFNNGYKADDLDVDLSGSKGLEGRDLVDGEFSFRLYESDINGIEGTLLETVANAGNNFAFAALIFEDGDEGTHYYLIKEVEGILGGVTYDQAKYLVKVVITDDLAGNLEAEVTYYVFDTVEEDWVAAEEVVFNNAYKAGDLDVDLGGSKNLDGRNLANGEFSFRLYESDTNGIEGTLVETVTNTGSNFAFAGLTFEDGDEGTYYYLIKEVEGTLGGVSYDQTKYLVKVVITDDLAGNLEAEVTYYVFDTIEEVWVAAEEVIFNNAYEAGDLDVDLGGSKNLDGRDLADGEFSFRLYESDTDGIEGTLLETVANAGNNFAFAALTFEDGDEGIYYYLIKEVEGILGGVSYDQTKYLVKVVITDDLAGNLEAEVTYFIFDTVEEAWVAAEEAAFTNEYKADDVDVDLGGSKYIEGRDLVDDEFSFRLYESDINGIEGTLVETVANAGNNFAFAALTFVDGDEGTYYYLIKEVEGTLGGVSYDQTKYLVKVVITDNLAGKLEAEVTYFIFDADEEVWVAAEVVVFNNEYKADDVDVDLGGSKYLEGRDLADGEFSFRLYESDTYGIEGTLLETVANAGNNFAFAALTFEDGDEGTYYYLIKEVEGTLGGVTYDQAKYLVKVVIKDNLAGNLEAEVTYYIFDAVEEVWVAAEEAAFTNEYKADDVDVDLGGRKNLEGRDLVDGEFSFRLYESDINGIEGTLLETVANTGNNFAFAALTFEDGDEGIYYYLIKEVEGILGGVTYDLTGYLVKVIITDDFAGKLEAEVLLLDYENWTEYDPQNLVFNNVYNADQIGVTITGVKIFEDRDIESGAFRFKLFESDAYGQAGSLIETVSNLGANFKFSQLIYNDGEEGTYHYLVTEEKGTEEGIIYDTAKYLVIITVKDNLKGELTASVNYLLFDEVEENWLQANSIVFENFHLALEVEKMVEESKFSEAGDQLHYSFAVTNTGTLPFVKLTVNDPRLGIVNMEIDLSADPLQPGETYVHEFTSAYIVVPADIEAAQPIVNTLTVIGETEEGFKAEDKDDVTVPFEQTAPFSPPRITVEKLAKESKFSKAGDLVHYYFKVKNTGPVPVVKLTVNDPKLGVKMLVIDLSDDPLLPGETYTYEFKQAYVVTEADVKAGKIDNILNVIGESADGAEYEASDDLRINREQILSLPATGEYRSYWMAIVALVLAGAVAILLINRRRNMRIKEMNEE